MDALTEARETNQRLNRRLGSMENHLHSMVSRAQRETAEAQRVLGSQQSSLAYWVRSSSDTLKEVAHLKDCIVGLRTAIFFTSVWAVVATAATFWLAVR
jgi:hypothetical protein